MVIAAWITYLVFAFGIMPAVFRARFHRWPFAVAFPPRNAYDVVEYLYAALILTFSAALLAALPAPAATAGIGIVTMIFAVALQTWAVLTLGPNWRIGQDRTDPTCAFVRKGPYHLTPHPIYVSMGLVSAGQALMMGWDCRSAALVLGNLVYGLVQARAEALRWHAAPPNA